MGDPQRTLAPDRGSGGRLGLQRGLPAHPRVRGFGMLAAVPGSYESPRAPMVQHGGLWQSREGVRPSGQKKRQVGAGFACAGGLSYIVQPTKADFYFSMFSRSAIDENCVGPTRRVHLAETLARFGDTGRG